MRKQVGSLNSHLRRFGALLLKTLPIFLQLVNSHCQTDNHFSPVHGGSFFVSYPGRIRGTDPVNRAEACGSPCSVSCCERVPDSSHTAGGKKSNHGP